MSSVTLESGHWVTPSLRLTRQLDEGAMGSLWLADHTRLDTEVVVKFVRESLAANETVKRRLEIEARAAARIRSPHVVRVFDFGFLEGTPYIVMEYLEGQSLRERLDETVTLSLRDTMTLVNHTCRALQEAHRLGIVHRDIKPGNLYLLEDDVQGLFVKVLDFGVAKGLAQDITEPGGIVGTPAYLSPEHLRSKAATHMSDLWALAAVTYECIVGDGPFHGETVDEVFARIWRCQAEPPSTYGADVSAELDAWFARSLGRELDLRPQTASEFATSFFDAALTCDELLEGAPETWSSARWQLELDAPRRTLPQGTPDTLPRLRDKQISSVELTPAARSVENTLGGPHPTPLSRQTAHWSERPSESHPPAGGSQELDGLDTGTSSRNTSTEDLALPPGTVPIQRQRRGTTLMAGLVMAALLGVGLWWSTRDVVHRAPAVAEPELEAKATPKPPKREAELAVDGPETDVEPQPEAEPPETAPEVASFEAPVPGPPKAPKTAPPSDAPKVPPAAQPPVPAPKKTEHGKDLGF